MRSNFSPSNRVSGVCQLQTRSFARLCGEGGTQVVLGTAYPIRKPALPSQALIRLYGIQMLPLSTTGQPMAMTRKRLGMCHILGEVTTVAPLIINPKTGVINAMDFDVAGTGVEENDHRVSNTAFGDSMVVVCGCLGYIRRRLAHSSR
jgi:hypothetical protein